MVLFVFLDFLIIFRTFFFFFFLEGWSFIGPMACGYQKENKKGPAELSWIYVVMDKF